MILRDENHELGVRFSQTERKYRSSSIMQTAKQIECLTGAHCVLCLNYLNLLKNLEDSRMENVVESMPRE